MTRSTRRMKQEPVVDHSGDLLPTPPQSSHTSHNPDFTPVNMPLRAGSQPISVRGASTVPLDMSSTATTNGDHDVDMAETTTPDREAMGAMGDQSRQLIQAIQKLEALNIKSTLPSLPMFVVIGDQSAGKSSIIEAACDITLPRNEGTCTRCPFKITTTASKNGQPWTCKISLHLDYAYTPGKLASAESTFDHWLDQDRLTRPFTTVYSKADLDLALRRAQLAILNPHKDHMTFVDAPLQNQSNNTQKVGFSPNVISLEITAPELPELSFYDLPGAINTLADESQQYLVNFVELLLKKYIANEKAYILLACAANQDLDTSTAFRFLRDCKASSRSMGILTKSDLVDLSKKRLSDIRNLLLGVDYRLGNGWFVTRQLSQKEIDEQHISHSEARRLESTFFQGKPWSADLAEFSSRFGISNLAGAISRTLTQHILSDLPEIVQRVQTRLDIVENDLAHFPAPAHAPSLTVITEVGNVNKAIIDEINADRFVGTFRKDYREVFRAFAKKLQSLKPFVVGSTPGYVKPSISLSSDGEEESPTKSIRMNGGVRGMSMTPSQSAQKRARRAPTKQPSDNASATRVVFRLDETKVRFDSAPGADIPGQVSESVVRDLICDALSSWSSIPEGVVKQVKALFLKMLNKTIEEALPQYHNTEFLRQVKEAAFNLLDELHDHITEIVISLVAAETHRPITYNTSLLTKTRSAHEHELRKRRNEARTEEYYDDLEAEGRKVPAKPDQKKKAADPEFIKSILGDDEFEREVKALATPLAYYEIVSAQLVDSVAKQIELGLMAAFESRLQRKLCEDLRVQDPDRCAELLAENPETERRRAQLVAEKGRLLEALAELNSLPALHA